MTATIMTLPDGEACLSPSRSSTSSNTTPKASNPLPHLHFLPHISKPKGRFSVHNPPCPKTTHTTQASDNGSFRHPPSGCGCWPCLWATLSEVASLRRGPLNKLPWMFKKNREDLLYRRRKDRCHRKDLLLRRFAAASPNNPRSQQSRHPTRRSPSFVKKDIFCNGSPTSTYLLQKARRHWGWWSLLPAFVALLFCSITREPLTALFGGVLTGACMLGRHNITEAVLVPTMATQNTVGVLLLYLVLLGGLLGLWSRTGAAQAFADLMARRFVRGPRSARLVAWGLGVLFFQGGTMSAVFVGATVKPLADAHRISHEKCPTLWTRPPLQSPVCWPLTHGRATSRLPFCTRHRVAFDQKLHMQIFFLCIPFSFYAILAVLGTFLLCIDRAPFLGRRMHAAIRRARETGRLDAPNAQPLAAKELPCQPRSLGLCPSCRRNSSFLSAS